MPSSSQSVEDCIIVLPRVLVPLRHTAVTQSHYTREDAIVMRYTRGELLQR